MKLWNVKITIKRERRTVRIRSVLVRAECANRARIKFEKNYNDLICYYENRGCELTYICEEKND